MFMKLWRNAAAILFVFVGAVLGLFPSDSGTGAAQGPNRAQPEVTFATRSDVSAALRSYPVHPPLPAKLGEIFQRERKLLPNRMGSAETDTFDPAVQTTGAGGATPLPDASFGGVGNVNGYLPPDITGAIGLNHYVQMVNASYAIFSRNGTKVLGPLNNNALWSGFGGPCETRNDGDPIVVYDRMANRWVMSQFALPNYPFGPFYQCIAVSQTSDPTLSWYRYEFLISQQKLNDYPKLGVWGDGYYMSVNQFRCLVNGSCSWAGAGVVAFERDAMLTGAPARMVYFDLESVDPNLGGMLPSDLDGPPPAAGTPNYFAQMDDDSWGYSPDQLQIWEFKVNWSAPAQSTFSLHRTLPVTAFNSNMCNYARNCIAQPGGTKVDALSDRLMYRLQYRHFGGYDTLVANHTVDANGLDRAGLRWYELRNVGTGWNVFQQATYAPDTHNRWIGSIAMNGIGDIALGFSKASTTLSASIAVAGRQQGDPLDTLRTQETVLVNGSGYQTHSSGRWGDYSQMTIDPTDDCTFWYTGEYYDSVSSAGWKTIIGSVKLRDCATPPTDNTAPTTSITAPANGATVAATVTVSATASDNVGVTRVEFYVDNVFQSQVASAPYNWSWNTTGVGNGSHSLTTKAFDAAGNVGTSIPVSVTVNNAGPPPPSSISLTATGYKVKGVQQADLRWSGATTATVRILRNGSLIATPSNSSGAYTDNINRKGAGTYRYQVCEATPSTACSNEVTVSF
jgi:hypothetical protein